MGFSLFDNPFNKFERKLFNSDPLNGALFGKDGAEKILGLDSKSGFGTSIAKAMEAAMAGQQAPAAAPADTLMTPTAMPTADSDAQRAARRKSQADQAKRRGRQSTILTNNDPLGADG